MPNSGPIKKTQAPAPATSAAPELLRDPEPIARPTDVLLLQRHAGNQAVERWLHAGQAPAPVPGAPVMLQTKPVAGRSDSSAEHTREREPARVAPTLIVDDDAESVGPGQMRKSDFLRDLKASVCTTAEEALRGTIWSAMGCPYIERWFNHYQEQSSQHVERALHHYAPETASARTARDYIPLITQRLRRGITEWARTGEVTGVPPELAQQGMPGATLQGLVGAGLSALGGAVSGLVSGAGRALSSVGRALFKPRSGGAREEGDPHALQARLGEGHALEGSVRARMEAAFGQSFAQVRLHTDAHAAQVSDGLNARAFTVGRHVAFGAGEYQPGTLIGDALIAHELAHVAQQGQGAAASGPLHKGGGAYSALEEDADVAAVGAVAALWGGAQGRLSDIGHQAMPRLRSGLQLQRCGAQRQTRTPDQARQATRGQGESTAQCSVREPENCATYEEWLLQFNNLPTYVSPTGHRVLGPAAAPAATATDPQAEQSQRRPPVLHERSDYLPTDRFIDGPTEQWVRANLPANLVETAYQLPSDCADIAVILRHVWLSAHHRTEVYRGWVCGSRVGEARSRDMRDLILNQVYSGSVSGIVSPYTDEHGTPLLSFQALQRVLHPGDILVWEHRNPQGGRTGGHTHTIIHVERQDGRVAEITALQGNQPIGPASAQASRQQDIQAQQERRQRGQPTQPTPTVDELRAAPGRRIEVSQLSRLGFNDVNGVWTWSDGTVLLAAGPPAAAPRPAPQQRRGQPTIRRLSDWLAPLQRVAADDLESTFESALLETRAMIESGRAVTAEEARDLGQTAGDRLRQLTRESGDLGSDTYIRRLTRMRAQVRAINARSNTPQQTRAIFEEIDRALNEAARGLSSVNFQRTTRRGERVINILLTGFDPWNVSTNQPQARAGEWNPSGAAVTMLDGETIPVESQLKAAVESVVLPVSYDEFRGNLVERIVNQHRDADAIITVSLDPNVAPEGSVQIERFAVGVHQESGQHEAIPRAEGARDTGPAIIETRAPVAEIASEAAGPAEGERFAIQPTVGTDVTFAFANAAEANAALRALGQPSQGQAEVSIANVQAIQAIMASIQRDADPRSAGISFTAGGRTFHATIRRGPGGAFLSNEVSYRVLRALAASGRGSTPSFHVHTPRGTRETAGLLPEETGTAESARARQQAVGLARRVLSTVVESLRRIVRSVARRISAPTGTQRSR